jgi:hypothetical protein
MNMMKVWKASLMCTMLVLSSFYVQAQTQLEKDFESFRNWINKKASQADSTTKAEWPDIKNKFSTKTATLDRNTTSMSPESKDEYDQLKSRFKTMEAKHDGQFGDPLNREEAAKWEKELTGKSSLKKIKADDLRVVYLYFIANVREQRAQWSLRDWEYAEHVYLELGNRKQAVLDKLSNSDKIRIAAMQVEFNTLRKSRDAKDKLNEMREK